MLNSSHIIGNATVSVVQAVISGLILFLLYGYLIDHIGAEQLGLWSVILASTSVAKLGDMGLAGSVVKFVARYRALEKYEQAAEVVQTAAISIALVMALLLLAAYPMMDFLLTFVIPVALMPHALSILPWAFLSLWLSSVGAVFQSGLDGCQRMDTRNILMIAGNILFFLLAIWLVPHYGLVGLAVGQAIQGLLLGLASWLVLRRELTTLPLISLHWSKPKLKEMFAYSVNFQINSIAILLFEPVTKLLMSRYGGLSSAAYYEMASQLVIRLRAMLISANQALVPAVAELHETSPEKVRELYLMAYRWLFFVIVPFYTAIMIALPVISVMWIGHIEIQFLLFGALLTLGWCLNNLSGPAYFVNLGTGNLKLNSISHVLMAILNALLGLALAPAFGSLGVSIGAMIALVISSAFIIYALHRQYSIPLRTIVPPEHYLLLIVLFSCIAVSGWMNVTLPNIRDSLITGTINFSVFIMLIGIVIWFHPYKAKLFHRLRIAGVNK